MGFKMESYSIHTTNCPDGCSFGWIIDSLMVSFQLDRTDIENLKIGDKLEINQDLILIRDE